VSNPDGSLTPGQFGRVVIEGDAPHDALLVAETAVISDATDKVLDVVGADDKVEQRTVVLGGLFGEFREIRSGLKRDDRVIVAGFQHAESGDKVVPQPQTLNAGQLPAVAGVQ
jgi:multidrug efflux pump subunit AcrA (membrane-fusion protein)